MNRLQAKNETQAIVLSNLSRFSDFENSLEYLSRNFEEGAVISPKGEELTLSYTDYLFLEAHELNIIRKILMREISKISNWSLSFIKTREEIYRSVENHVIFGKMTNFHYGTQLSSTSLKDLESFGRDLIDYKTDQICELSCQILDLGYESKELIEFC